MSRNVTTIVALLAAAAAAAAAVRGATAPPRPSASAEAIAISVVLPGGGGATTPPASGSAVSTLPSFTYPSDGSVVVSGASSASTAARLGRSTASSQASSSVADVSLFDGEITAASVGTAASATTQPGVASGRLGRGSAVGLQALGRPVRSGSVALGDWGRLVVEQQRVTRAAPHGVAAYAGTVAGIDIVLTRAHGGLPAGSSVELAVVSVHAATAPPPTPAAAVVNPLTEAVPGDRPQLLPVPTAPLLGVPQVATPSLLAGPYVFPVYGRAAVNDDFGSLAPDVDYAHGDEIATTLGQPVLAAAAGTLYDVGWSRVGGNRLWLRDGQGNEFYYGQLSAFSSLAANGAHVAAGQVIGFVGDTGESQGATALEFQVHPVSLLYLGPQGSVDPTTYLAAWQRVASLSLAPGPSWAPSVPATMHAPAPGALLVGRSTISSASGLDPAGLRRLVGGSNDG